MPDGLLQPDRGASIRSWHCPWGGPAEPPTHRASSRLDNWLLGPGARSWPREAQDTWLSWQESSGAPLFCWVGRMQRAACPLLPAHWTDTPCLRKSWTGWVGAQFCPLRVDQVTPACLWPVGSRLVRYIPERAVLPLAPHSAQASEGPQAEGMNSTWVAGH